MILRDIPGIAFSFLLLPGALVGVSEVTPAQGIKHVTDYGANPNDGVDDTPGIRNAIVALGNGDTLLFDEPGVYEVKGAHGGAPIFTITLLSDVTVTSVPGVTILLTEYDRCSPLPYPDVFSVNQCSNFTFKGASAQSPLIFDTEPADPAALSRYGLPFLQGRLVAKAVDVAHMTATMTIQLDDTDFFLPVDCRPFPWAAWEVVDGMPARNPQYLGGYVQAHVPGVQSQLVDLVYSSTSVTQLANWSIDNTVVVLLNDSSSFLARVRLNEGTTVLQDLLARHLPGKFMQANPNRDLLIDNVDVEPKKSDRRLAILRDGINAGAERLVMRDCDLQYCGDDGLVSHGSGWAVVDVGTVNTSNKTFELQQPCTIGNEPVFMPNQIMMLLDTSLSSSTQEFATILSTAGGVYAYANPSPGFETRLQQGGLAFNASQAILGAVIERCTVTNTKGVGISVRSASTRVVDCQVKKVTVAGIFAGGGLVCAYPWFAYAAPPHFLEITGCDLDEAGGFNPFLGLSSIEVVVASGGSVQMPTYSAARDVILEVNIHDNSIRNAPRAGVFAANVGGVAGLLVQNNTFVNCGNAGTKPEHQHAVSFTTCDSGTVSGNTFVNSPNQVYNPNSPNVTVQ